MKITTRSFAKTLFSLINENKKVLIGLSGGMDSVVLLDLCEKIIPSGKLFAIHINHGLTKESDNHEKFVYEICINKNIPLILKAEKRLPDILIACIGGGSNALGLFYEFLNEKRITIKVLLYALNHLEKRHIVLHIIQKILLITEMQNL